MIKTIILIISLISTVLFGNKHTVPKKLSYEKSVPLLQSINNDAIILGSGNKHIYVFIDPLCPHSRKFIRMVSHNKKMLAKYQYHLVLYSLTRLKSADVVSAIQLSPHPIETLLEIMVEGKVMYNKGNELIKEKADRIATVAKTINVYKRPYIFIVK